MKATSFAWIVCLLAFGTLHAQQQVPLKYVNHTEFGGLFGRVKFTNPNNANKKIVDNRLNLTLQTFNGITLNSRLVAGVTIGMDWYKTALLNPIAGGVRYDFAKKGNVKVFATADAGYGFTWLHDDSEGFETKGGLMLNPGVGLKIGKPGEAAVTLTMSYKRQEAHITKVPLWDQVERFEDRVYNRLALRLGVIF
ncbi:hypothetical protein [Dyadobacter sp. CY326]|uniref:hypothetical protein n=1 Tax=Dyadobacter sp. CY326 TaxID=2907300 RepID=UPI001F1BEFD0|nr:hypothetical protein [Dyadobacter sp. CY326]MCE7067581.1 hypothetical protein [Dyadobacter sp. CY326]